MPEVRVSDEPVCDFCSEPRPSRTFNVPDFPMDKTPGLPDMRSTGAWMACNACSAMIESERWDDLVNRAATALGKKHNMPARFLRETVKRSHDLFRKHWRKDETTQQHGS